MSAELTLLAGYAYSKNGVQIDDAVTGKAVDVSGNGTTGTVIAASTSDTALPLGGLVAPLGYGYFENLDPTNDIKIKAAVGGAVLALLKPGRPAAIIPLDTTITAPSFQASAGTPLLNYRLFPP